MAGRASKHQIADPIGAGDRRLDIMTATTIITPLHHCTPPPQKVQHERACTIDLTMPSRYKASLETDISSAAQISPTWPH
ncbi:hypothetical protein CDD83_2221 [Cordyceps sp. RAO-2017]|nr:hypothetical protein CDD83_2221 [Cordyceps sp. RAO-2017]